MIAQLIYTYNRTWEAMINMELSRKILASLNPDNQIHIVHTYNGLEEFNYTPKFENEFYKIANRGHFRGAVDLINLGVRKILENKQLGAKYLIVTASDTWLVKPDYIQAIIDEMQAKELPIAACPWGMTDMNDVRKVGFSLDFFILDLAWQQRSGLFPLKYDEFLERFQDTNYALGGGVLVPERCFVFQWVKYWEQFYTDLDLKPAVENNYRRLLEREPVHLANWQRRAEWPEIGLYTNHDRKAQQQALREIIAMYPTKFSGNELLVEFLSLS